MATKPKIAMIGTEMLPIPPVRGGAIQTYIEGVAPFLAKHFNLTIVSVADEGLPAEERVGKRRYVRLARQNDKASYYKAVCDFIGSERWDLVEVFNRPAAVPLIGEAAGDARMVLSMHNEMFKRKKLDPSEGEACLNRVDAVVTISQFIKRGIGRLYPNHRKKLVRILSGVDLERFKPRWESSDLEIAVAQRATGIDGEGPLVLLVSRLSPKKGVHLVVSAMPKILEAYPQARLVIVGSRWYGSNEPNSYSQEVHGLASQFGGAVRMTGYVPYLQVSDYFKLADVFVCASQWKEPLARVHYEALACGLPIVTTDRGGNMEVIKEGVNGLVARPYDDPIGFANAIIEILSHPEKRLEIGAVNRRLAKRRHSWRRVAKNLREVFDGALSLRGAAPEAAEHALANS